MDASVDSIDKRCNNTHIDYGRTAGCVSMIKLDMIQELIELIKTMYYNFSKYNQYLKNIVNN